MTQSKRLDEKAGRRLALPPSLPRMASFSSSSSSESDALLRSGLAQMIKKPLFEVGTFLVENTVESVDNDMPNEGEEFDAESRAGCAVRSLIALNNVFNTNFKNAKCVWRGAGGG